MSLKQYKDAIENSNIVSKTDTAGIITFVNDEFCKISGFSREELIGKNHNIVRHPDVPASKFKLLWDTINAKKTYKSTVKNRAKDGSTFYVNTTVTPILDEKGDIKEFIAIRYDVTKEVELKQALEKHELELEQRVQEQTKQLKELNKTLEQRVQEEIRKNEQKQKMLFRQSRLASLGQMIANIAHQWRQPLAELNLTLFNIKKASMECDVEKVSDFYSQSKKIIKNMSNTIEDFSNFFNPNRKKESFLLGDALNESLQILAKDLEKEKISVEKDFKNVQVRGVFNEFSHVMINLIQNSKDAFIQNDIPERKIKLIISIKYKDSKKFAYVSVEDNAGGIDEDNIEKIFEPYFTTKHKSKGTGLGLHMSYKIIVESLKGDLYVENTQNGAKFFIELPLS